MDKQLFWATLSTVFLAELGDKTQLAAMTATARSGAIWTVFFAACTALILATALGVTVGSVVFRLVPEQLVKYLAGAAFIAVGIWVMVKG
ncbi:MAG TPA: TMEM165/GDT1 family protein [Holophaga sp.]|nr:TMEM165/GDT1 family protein [Holophaga sp.]